MGPWLPVDQPTPALPTGQEWPRGPLGKGCRAGTATQPRAVAGSSALPGCSRELPQHQGSGALHTTPGRRARPVGLTATCSHAAEAAASHPPRTWQRFAPSSPPTCSGLLSPSSLMGSRRIYFPAQAPCTPPPRDTHLRAVAWRSRGCPMSRLPAPPSPAQHLAPARPGTGRTPSRLGTHPRLPLCPQPQGPPVLGSPLERGFSPQTVLRLLGPGEAPSAPQWG